MRKILEMFVERRRATLLFFLVAMLMGYAAYLKIPRESSPEVKIPMIYILMQYEGISPEDGERLLLQPMENALGVISNITKMTSYAHEGGASIVLEFNAGFDSAKALRDVRDRVSDTKHKLPHDIENPIVREIDLSLEPVLNVILAGEKISNQRLTHIARDLRNKIEGIDGVLEVIIRGDKEEVVELIVQPHILERYGLPLEAVTSIMSTNNQLVTAGTLRSEGGHYAVKVPSLVKSLEELLNFPIKAGPNGVLRLGDIAKVQRTFKDASSIARVNGKPAMVLEISKKTGANIINTVQAVRSEVSRVSKSWPADLEVLYSQDQSDQIHEMILELENSIILAGILVLVVIIIAVGLKSALIIALSLPYSFLFGILIMSQAGITLNMVVLFSLILTIGMIVDDAIVVSEYADRRMTEGSSPADSFLEAATRMFWPIVTSTLVKIVVFLPLLFWPGVIGQFMKYMPLTVVIILTNSLFFALFFQSALGSLLLPGRQNAGALQAIQASEDGDLNDLRGWTAKYFNLLSAVLAKPKRFILIVSGTLVFVYAFFFIAGTGVEFFPKVEPSLATITIGSPGNLSLEQRDSLLKEVEEKIYDMRSDLKVIYAKSFSGNPSQMFPGDTIAAIQLELEDWRTRRKAAVIFGDIKQRLSTVSGITFQILEARDGPPSQKPIEINFTAQDYKLLPPFVAKFRAAMKDIGGFQDTEDSRPVSAIEWHLVFDREMAAKHGVNVRMVGNAVKLVTNGLKVSSYWPDDYDDKVDILLRYPVEMRLLSELDNIVLTIKDGKKVPITNIVKRVAVPQVPQLKKTDHDLTITVKSDVQRGVLVDTKVQEIKKWLAENLEEGIEVKYAGDDKEQKETGEFLTSAFLLALLMMFIIMLIQFNNFYHTFVVMSAVFLSTVGVLIGLLLSWQPFGIVMCGIGIIALAGVVLNNNIIFVDTYQHLRKKGFSVEDAALRAGVQRVRPIVLTAVTAVLGLMPMVCGVSFNFFDMTLTYDAPSSQWWRQLAASIAGGLSFATVLTLFFTPCLLVLEKRFEKTSAL